MKRGPKQSRVYSDDEDDDDESNTSSNNNSSSEDESSSSSSDESSSSSSSDDEKYTQRSQSSKNRSSNRGTGSLSQMKASADREKARMEKSSGEPPKKRGRPSKHSSGGDDDDDDYAGKDTITKDEHDRLVSMAIQLFLFSNTHKRPIKREDISEHVLKDYKGRKSLRKLSKSVFDDAVAKMKDIFGYELKLLKKPVVKGDLTTTPSTSAFYVLVNTLTKTQEDSDDDNSDDDDDDDNNNGSNNSIGKKREETLVPLTLVDDTEAAYHGLLMLILGIIVLSNGIIQEESLFERLKMAKIGSGDGDDPVFKNVKDVVSSFVSQQYLTRIKTRGAKKTDEPIKNIVIGPRTFVEFNLKEIVIFVMRMFGYKELNEKHIDAILSSQSSQASN